ncbi:MAG: hypothetical protein HQK84_05535 [Nitrospinae bacterium]|nr:hypothetical protein [Nitrospinota bacterium]
MKKIKLLLTLLICLSLPLNSFAMLKASEMRMGNNEASMQSVHCDQMKQSSQKSSPKEASGKKQMNNKCNGGSCCVVLSYFAPSFTDIETSLIVTAIDTIKTPPYHTPSQEKIYHPPIS